MPTDEASKGHRTVTAVTGQPPRRTVVNVTVTPEQLQGSWWEREGVNIDALAAVAALTHLQHYNLFQVCRNFVHSQPLTTVVLPTQCRGLSMQFLTDFQREFMLPKDMKLLVVKHLVRFLTAGTGRYCTLTVHSLYTHYTLTIHSLYNHCTPTTHSLYTHYTPTIQELS
jgi:hypothetical protein